MGIAMNPKPSRSVTFIGACLVCSLACVLTTAAVTSAKPASGKRSLVLPKGTVTEWKLVPPPAQEALPITWGVTSSGDWLPRFALYLPSVSSLAPRVQAQAEQRLPFDTAGFTAPALEKWLASALKRTRALEKERELARKKEEEAERAKANAAYVPPASATPPAAVAGAPSGSTAPPPATPITGALQQAQISQTPDTPPAAKTPSAPASPGAKAPAASATAGAFNQAAITKAPEPQKTPPAPAGSAPATPSALGQAAVTPKPTPGTAPGQQVAALTPPPAPTAPVAPPKTSTITQPSASKQTQDPTVLATPEGKSAHDSFRQFCTMFVKKVESSYDKGTLSNIKVEKRGLKYVAQYMAVDQDSVQLLVKTSGYDHTPFVGVLQYSEQLFEAEGDSAQAAKAGAFKLINSVKVRELFRYANKKWQF
ncbi:hypothetical protein JCM14635_19380 [Megalodesulfovibrio paquesii]